MKKPESIDDYILMQPTDVQEVLQQVRTTIAKAAPNAVEIISYAMPTFYQKGNLVHFAAFKKHIGFYAMPTGHEAFAVQLSKYKQGKGSVQFPLNEAMPLKLMTDIVKYRVIENEEKAKLKK